MKFFKENKLLAFIAFVNFIFIYASSFIQGYEYFIDEFYYIACANNPAMGYVDHPPLAPVIMMIYKFIFGDSLYAIRFLPALASSATVFLSGIIAKHLGGNKTAQIISAFSVFVSPLFLVLGSFYSMNVFEPLLAAITIYFILKMINENNPKYLVHCGIVFGLLLMNKHTAALLILFFVVFMLFTPQRKYLFTKYFVYCIIITSLIFLPNIIWQIQNGYPSVEFYITNVTGKNLQVSVSEFIIFQALAYNPFVFLISFAGTFFILFNKKVRKYRLPALIFLFTFAFFFITKNMRIDRLAYAYIMVIPAGAIFLENIITRINKKWIFPVTGFVSLIFMLAFIPLFMPYLSYENSEKLTNFYGLNTEMEKGKKPRITQMLSDKVGWKEKVDMAGSVFLSFPEVERKNTIIAADYYGIAGALEFYGQKYGIKNVVCSHNNYFLWSKNRLEGDIVLQLTKRTSYKGLTEAFNNVDSTGAYYDNEFCSPEGRDQTVFICRNPKHPLEEILEKGKHYY